MKYYITKYALTKGIYSVEGSLYGEGILEYRPDETRTNNTSLMFAPYWHKTIEDAIAHAEELRIKKLQSLDKQIKKVSALVFELR